MKEYLLQKLSLDGCPNFSSIRTNIGNNYSMLFSVLRIDTGLLLRVFSNSARIICETRKIFCYANKQPIYVFTSHWEIVSATIQLKHIHLRLFHE